MSRPTTEVVCEFCGNKFLALDYSIKIGYGKFCSRSCTAKGRIARQGDFSGVNHPGWKEDKTPRTETIRNYRQRFPLKNSAHKKVHRAIKSGRLVKMPCETCGSVSSEAHHEDYSKPLDVHWLCRQHHRAIHNERKHSERT